MDFCPIEHWLLTPSQHSQAPPNPLVGLDPLAKALAIAKLVQQTRRPVIAIFNTKAEARNAIDNIRFFLGPQLPVHYLPALDFDFHRNLVPNPEDQWEKNRSLFQLIHETQPCTFVTTTSAMIQRVLTPEIFLESTVAIRVDSELNREALINQLVRNGYQPLPNASDPGSFAVRGGIVDIFSPLYSNPLRIEYFGDLVESMRFFNPSDQRSLDEVKKAYCIPVKAVILPPPKTFSEVATLIKERLDTLGIPKSDRDELILRIQDLGVNSQFELLFPLLSSGASPLYEYFPSTASILIEENIIDRAAEIEYPLFKKNFELYERRPSPIAPFSSLALGQDDFRNWVQKPEWIRFTDYSGIHDSRPLHTVTFSWETSTQTNQLPLESLVTKFRALIDEGTIIHIACHSRLHAERLRSLLGTYHIFCELHDETAIPIDMLFTVDFQKIHLWSGFVNSTGFYPHLKTLILSEESIFGKKKRTPAHKSQRTAAQQLSIIKELKVGDFIVHKDHGIGKYLGLQSRDFLGIPNDYAVIEYRDSDKLYVPVYRLNVIQKFSSAEAAAPAIDKLGGERWARVKAKAQKAVARLAAQFLDTHAKRKLIPIVACPKTDTDYEKFEMEFPFDETSDQLRAIDELNHDLELTHPMSRLLCGDVGYGKTEIAMRAAYRIASSARQAAILVPTTILAFQHFETFQRRFRDTPLRIDMISRLRSSARIKASLQALSEEKTDIIIGTHRLLSSDCNIPKLGLVVIDEEHRFGVLHKERLKRLSANVHVLSMTATPIPRTLNMAMAGILDISILNTPPPDRLSVRTFVCRHDPTILKEAIANEIARKGQVYYVHNRIESLPGITDELKELFPSLHFEVVHGQIEAEELEKRMIGFFKNDFQVLVTTAIVESGLDNPKANTIIIDRADQFGLAQLYQLRGRVGRSDKRAYCYLMIPSENQITPHAKLRLQVMQRYSDLGSGFQVASQDLDARGAGDLLGEQQSGHVNAVGTDLYFELLEEAILELQGKPPKNEIEPDINLRVPAYFPEAYLPDISERVNIYRRLSALETSDEISMFESEIKDRFGKPPEEVINLLGLMLIRLHLKRLHVIRMSCGPKKTSFQFATTTPASPEQLVKLIQKNPRLYSLTPDQKLVVESPEPNWKTLLSGLETLAQRLGL